MGSVTHTEGCPNKLRHRWIEDEPASLRSMDLDAAFEDWWGKNRKIVSALGPLSQEHDLAKDAFVAGAVSRHDPGLPTREQIEALKFGPRGNGTVTMADWNGYNRAINDVLALYRAEAPLMNSPQHSAGTPHPLNSPPSCGIPGCKKH